MKSFAIRPSYRSTCLALAAMAAVLGPHPSAFAQVLEPAALQEIEAESNVVNLQQKGALQDFTVNYGTDIAKDLLVLTGKGVGNAEDVWSLSNGAVSYGSSGKTQAITVAFETINGLAITNNGDGTTYYFGNNGIGNDARTSLTLSNISITQKGTDASEIVLQGRDPKNGTTIDGLKTETTQTMVSTALDGDLSIKNLELAENGTFSLRTGIETSGQYSGSTSGLIVDRVSVAGQINIKSAITFKDNQYRNVTFDAAVTEGLIGAEGTTLFIDTDPVDNGFDQTITFTGSRLGEETPSGTSTIIFNPSASFTGTESTKLVFDGNGSARFVVTLDNLKDFAGTIEYRQDNLDQTASKSGSVLLLTHYAKELFDGVFMFQNTSGGAALTDPFTIESNVTLDGAVAFQGSMLGSARGLIDVIKDGGDWVETLSSNPLALAVEQKVDVLLTGEGGSLTLGKNFGFALTGDEIKGQTLGGNKAYIQVGDVYDFSSEDISLTGNSTYYFSGKLTAVGTDGQEVTSITGDTAVSKLNGSVRLAGIKLGAGVTLTLDSDALPGEDKTGEKYLFLRGYDLETGALKTSCAKDENCGIFGEGNILVDGDVYLGGYNAFTGSTTITAGSSLHVDSTDALAASETLVLENGASLLFDAGSAGDFNFKTVTILGTADIGTESGTGTGGGQTEHSITLSGTGSVLSYLDAVGASQISTLSPDDGLPEDAAEHVLVTVSDTDVNIKDGAEFRMNYTPYTTLRSLLASAANDTMAVLKLENSDLTLEGAETTQDGTVSSAHLYIGNGILKLAGTSTLNFGADSAIHFGSHLTGFFENNTANPGYGNDPHNHWSVEMQEGATVSVTLSGNNHLYADHIIDSTHEHRLIGTDSSAQTEEAFFNYGNVAMKVNDNFNEEAAALVADFDQKYGTTLADKLKQADGTTLAAVYEEAKQKGVSDEVFYASMGQILTASLAQSVHGQTWQEYYLTVDENGVYMSAEGAVVPTEFKQWLSLQTNTDTVVGLLDGTGNLHDESLLETSGAVNIIYDAIGYAMANGSSDDLTRGSAYYTAARMIDAAGQIGTVGGAQTIAWDAAESIDNIVDRRLKSPEGDGLWVEGVYLRTNSWGMYNDYNGDRQNKADLRGFVLGAQVQTNEAFRIGGSLAYMQGDAEDEFGFADQVRTTNDASIYNLALFARADVTDNVYLTMKAGVQAGYNDLNMSFPLGLVGETLHADVDTMLWNAALRLHARFEPVKGFGITPYVGVKYSRLSTDDYTSRLGSMNAFHTEKADQDIVSVPVGVLFEGNRTWDDGSSMRIYLDAYVQPNFGDTEVTNVVTGEGLQTTDTVHPEVIGEVGYGVSVGAGWGLTPNMSAGISLSVLGSEKTANPMVTGNLKYTF